MSDTMIRMVVISVPPNPLVLRLERLRRALCEVSGSSAALKYPVHLTLRTGVVVPESMIPGFIDDFGEHAAAVESFWIRLGSLVTTRFPSDNRQGGGACFAGFEIDATEGLMRAHRDLLAFSRFRKGEQYEYRPHVTMAFDDLTDEGLERIKQAVQGIRDSLKGESWECRAAECHSQVEGIWKRTATLKFKDT